MMHEPWPPAGERHTRDCACDLCKTFRPAPSDRLTASHLGWLAIGGTVFGHVVAIGLFGRAAVTDALLVALGVR